MFSIFKPKQESPTEQRVPIVPAIYLASDGLYEADGLCGLVRADNPLKVFYEYRRRSESVCKGIMNAPGANPWRMR